MPFHPIHSAKRAAKSIVFGDTVPCFWSKTKNWGDALSPRLVELISGRQARFDHNPNCWKHFVIGSILDHADHYSIVWGSGMISPEALPKQTPSAIHAVRGPLTRERLLLAGISCPAVYGDPALLLPRFFDPKRERKRKIGIIPHYSDQGHPWLETIQKEDDVTIIDIYSGIESFVEELVSCDCILSSSLHGLICADSYSIPNRRMVLHGNLIGDDFKFSDYYAAADTQAEPPIHPKAHESAADLIPAIERTCENFDLDRLFNACPFRPGS